MSNALAIAAVTAVLKDLLNNAVIDQATTTVGKAVSVSALPPDRIMTGETEKAQLNLFLYHVEPNVGWRNMGLPSRDQSGGRISNPPLALDLYYLLTAYGAGDLECEILLGYGMQLLHETPMLTRQAIRTSLKAPSPVGGDLLPYDESKLSAVELADQVESIRIVLYTVNTEEMSKLWTAFQAKYRPSVAYHASVVLIESAPPSRSPLPVLSRGRIDPISGRDEGVQVRPDLSKSVPPNPVLQDVEYPDKQLSACLGDSVTMTGFNLDGDVIFRFENKRLTEPTVLPVSNQNSGQITLQLPSDQPDKWPAGRYTVTAFIRRPGKTYREATNQIPFVLAPKITLPFPDSLQAEENTDVPGLLDITMTIKCSPLVNPGQRVSLLLNDREALSESFTDGTSATFIFKAIPPGEYLARLRVDGVDSHFIDYTKQPPEFTKGSKVTIP